MALIQASDLHCTLIIAQYLLFFDETSTESQKCKYFHLWLLPSPWKSGVHFAAVVKSRMEIKYWQKLFLTGAIKLYSCRCHGLLPAE